MSAIKVANLENSIEMATHTRGITVKENFTQDSFTPRVLKMNSNNVINLST